MSEPVTRAKRRCVYCRAIIGIASWRGKDANYDKYGRLIHETETSGICDRCYERLEGEARASEMGAA